MVFKKKHIPWNKGKKCPEISEAKKGIKHTEKTKHKISLSHKGSIPWNKGTTGIMPSGEKSRVWKGNEVGYTALHDWVKKWKPKPSSCEKCSKPTDNLDCANISGQYKRDLNDFWYLCKFCHNKYDSAKQIRQLTKEGNLIKTWDCIREAARELQIQHQHLVRVAKGRRKSAGGFKWEYA